MYDMKEKIIFIHLVLLVDVREGVQHIPEVLKIIINRFPVKT